jgi:hypothetical protein
VTEPVTEHISVETAPVSVQPEPVDGHSEPVSVDRETLAAQPEPVTVLEPIIVRPQPVRSRADEDPEAPWHRL